MSDAGKNAGAAPPQEHAQGSGVSRRDFLNEVAAAALGIAGLGAAVVTVKYISPNALFEPPTRFHIGVPEDYPINSVTFLRDQQVFVVRTMEGFIALSAICTHLGCITEWKAEDDLLECPCHGSKFQRDGTKVAGPAPRPLPHLSIRLGPDGELVVDKLNTVPASEVLKV